MLLLVMLSVVILVLTSRIGIIGEPLSQFNHVTLTPLGAETEEEENEKEGGGNRRE